MIVSVAQSQSYASFPINPCTQAARWSVDLFDNLHRIIHGLGGGSVWFSKINKLKINIMCSIELINTNILSGKRCFCLNYHRRYDCFNFPPLILATKISCLPTTLDPIFSLAGGLQKVYRRFSKRPDGPYQNQQSNVGYISCTREPP